MRENNGILEWWNTGFWENGFKSIEHGARSKELREKNTMLHAPCSLLLAHNIPCVKQKEHTSINYFRFSRSGGIEIPRHPISKIFPCSNGRHNWGVSGRPFVPSSCHRPLYRWKYKRLKRHCSRWLVHCPLLQYSIYSSSNNLWPYIMTQRLLFHGSFTTRLSKTKSIIKLLQF